MDMPFIYDRFVTGKNFIGRRSESEFLMRLLDNGRNVVIYEPPKTGKMSVIQQTLFMMRSHGKQFNAACIELFNVMDTTSFLVKFGNTIIRNMFSSPAEYRSVVERHLAGTHFVFDSERFSAKNEVVSIFDTPDSNDIDMMLRLPTKLARESGMQCIIILNEFHNLLEAPDCENIFKIMETVFEEESRTGSVFILSGSRVNAMKFIFEEKKWFHGLIEHLAIADVDEREIIEHIRKGFLSGGKVVEKEQALIVCRIFHNHLWYISHYCSICNSLSVGYINESIMFDALVNLISIHQMKFDAMMYSLTGFQINFLRAIIDGVVKFSANDIIDKYGLHSSANVKRMRESLLKKEIITFNERQEPRIIDPLFEYWVRRYYFEIEQ